MKRPRVWSQILWKNFYFVKSKAIKPAKTKELTWSMLPQASWFVFNCSLFLKSTRQKTCLKNSKSGMAMKRKKNNVLLASTKRLLETIIVEISWILRRELLFYYGCVAFKKTLLSRSLCKLRYLSAANLKICTNLVVVCLCSSISESWTHANEVVRESWNKLFVGFLEGLSFAGRVGLTSITGLAKLRNMPHTSKGKSNRESKCAGTGSLSNW